MNVVNSICILFSLFQIQSLFGQQAIPLNSLVIKGTHNSYTCCSDCFFGQFCDDDCPVMHNPLREQMDDWNVWAFELDFSVEILDNIPTLIVGHNSSTDTWSHTDWGITLKDFLVDIKNSRTFQYRPVVLKLAKKSNWGSFSYAHATDWQPLLDNLLLEVFSKESIIGPNKYYEELEGIWLPIPQLAGKVIPYVSCEGNCSPLQNPNETEYTFIGEPLPRWPINSDFSTDSIEWSTAALSGLYNIIASDDYQHDYNFSHIAPPNPIYIKSDAEEIFAVVNQYGQNCNSFNDKGKTFYVKQHGTFRFPFNQIEEAYEESQPGWTLLLHTGNYSEENLIFTKQLILKAEGGNAIIGE